MVATATSAATIRPVEMRRLGAKTSGPASPTIYAGTGGAANCVKAIQHSRDIGDRKSSAAQPGQDSPAALPKPDSWNGDRADEAQPERERNHTVSIMYLPS